MKFLVVNKKEFDKTNQEIENFNNHLKLAANLIKQVLEGVEKENFNTVKRAINDQQYQDVPKNIENGIIITSDIIKDLMKAKTFLQNNEKVYKNIASQLTDSDKLINEKSIENSADLLHKIILTGLRCIQIFVFIFVTYFAVSFATKQFNEDNLVIPRGLINIVPSEALSVQPQDMQTPESEKDQKSITSKGIEK